MKKLLTFAGVSALALVAATSDGFAATSNEATLVLNKSNTLGTFRPLCAEFEPENLQVKFWGLARDGKVTQLAPEKTIVYDFANDRWSLTAQEFINTIVSAANLEAYPSPYTKGLQARAVQFIGSGNDWTSELVKRYYATNLNYIAEGTITGMASGVDTTTLYTPAQIAAIEEMFVPLPTQPVADTYKLPTFSDDTKELYKDYLASTLNFIVLYAAKCVTNQYSQCELRVANDGTAVYKNSCKEGCWADSFGEDTKEAWQAVGEFRVDLDSTKFTESTVEPQYENLFQK